jgi:hypothetical protein
MFGPAFWQTNLLVCPSRQLERGSLQMVVMVEEEIIMVWPALGTHRPRDLGTYFRSYTQYQSGGGGVVFCTSAAMHFNARGKNVYSTDAAMQCPW